MDIYFVGEGLCGFLFCSLFVWVLRGGGGCIIFFIKIDYKIWAFIMRKCIRT